MMSNPDLSLPRVVVLVGPTASGKTQLGIQLAQECGGEIIAADSRTLYRGMDIGTGKPLRDLVTPPEAKSGCACDYYSSGILHHLIDVVDPDESFTMADFKERALCCLADIARRERVPFIIGGTGLYIKSLIDDLNPPAVVPQQKLRQELAQKSLVEQAELLKKITPQIAGEIDLQNPRRVVRALEIALSPRETKLPQDRPFASAYNFLELGLNPSREELYRRIDERIDGQLQRGLAEEVLGLFKRGYEWSLPSMSGIGYRQIGFFLEGSATYAEAMTRLRLDTKHYAKRQMTWFRRDKRIRWLPTTKDTLLESAFAEVHAFLARS